ncbi:hypothetical protein [Mongoliimonas terrestris]|uniref:hypothetical protein n=1 Tax=Mongoliimonas terrestris TaxID=1709001 RepID=UPI00094970A5|nr:hypothetical protein [Mongoliimonas terrestris]
MAAGDAYAENKILNSLSVLVEGQKKTLQYVSMAIDKFSVIETEMTKTSRRLISVEERLAHLQTETRSGASTIALRLDGVASRLEEIERTLDSQHDAIVVANRDLVDQYNQILTALQTSMDAANNGSDLADRVADLERRLGL